MSSNEFFPVLKGLRLKAGAFFGLPVAFVVDCLIIGYTSNTLLNRTDDNVLILDGWKENKNDRCKSAAGEGWPTGNNNI